jgi:sugar phosphate isomerase/epimerase
VTTDAPAWRISCSDSAFPALSHEVSLRVIRDLGIDLVDVCLFAGYRNNPPREVLVDPSRSADVIGERLAGLGLGVADVFAMIGEPWDALAVNSPDPAQRAASRRQFDALVTFAARLGAPAVTILPGAPFEGVAEADGIALAASELQVRAETAGQAGLELAVEPHVGSIAATVPATTALLEQAPDVWLTLDPSHYVYQGIEQRELAPLLTRTRHVQMRQARPGQIQTPVDEGTIDIAVFVADLCEAGYRGVLGIEYQWEKAMDFNRVDCIGETAVMRAALAGLPHPPETSEQLPKGLR